MQGKALTLREIQIGSSKILTSVAEICEKLNLTYYLAYGTLIGAIRHKGYIPWDDDIDIMMPREDYNSLVQYFILHEKILEPLKLYSIYNNASYPYMISRISDINYEIDTENEKPYGLGLFIDIYPLDGMGTEFMESKALKNKAYKYSSLCYLSTRLRFNKGNTKSKFKLIIKFPAFIYAKLRGKKHFMTKLENMAQSCDYESSNYIGCFVWGSEGIKGVFPKHWFRNAIEVEFEGNHFKVPVQYDDVLKRLYGDYMQLPPEKDRVGHHFYKAYKRQI